MSTDVKAAAAELQQHLQAASDLLRRFSGNESALQTLVAAGHAPWSAIREHFALTRVNSSVSFSSLEAVPREPSSRDGAIVGTAQSVVVVGSVNVDIIAETAVIQKDITRPGTLETLPGGKGANESVALARLGVPTQLIARVGDDQYGDLMLSKLRENNVDVSHVVKDEDSSGGTGLALVIKAKDQGAKMTIPCLRSNLRFGEDELSGLRELLKNQSVFAVLLQLEISLDACKEAADLAHKAGKKVFLKAAPMVRDQLDDGLVKAADVRQR